MRYKCVADQNNSGKPAPGYTIVVASPISRLHPLLNSNNDAQWRSVMPENAQNPTAQNPSPETTHQKDRGQLKWNMLRTSEKDSTGQHYVRIGLVNATGKYINAFFEDANVDVLEPHAEVIRISSSLHFLDNLKFYFDDNAGVSNPYPCTFTVNTSEHTFSWDWLPSDIVLTLAHLYDVPSYGDQSKLPPQSGNFPFALDQFGNSWCILCFSYLSDWS
jgi:hypothetical protein